MEDTDKKEDYLIASDKDEKNSSNKLISLIIIVCFILSIALVVLAIIVYLAKDKSLPELDVYKKYEKQEEIKLGGTGTVYKAKNKETNETVSIKEIKLKTKDIRNEVENDVKFKNASNHFSEYTFQLKEVFEQRSTKFLVTEYYDEDLSVELDKRENGFGVDEIKDILRNINMNLDNFRNHSVVYNNTKLENIIINKNGNGPQYKLIDFSKARLVTNNENETKKENKWGIKPVLGDINKEKQDLYDIGKEIYRMLFKEKGKKSDEMINKIKEKYNDTKLCDLMEGLLVEDSNKRISWEEYLNYTFFSLN